jgi:hypothetical protein
MTKEDKHLILQAQFMAQSFIWEADKAYAGRLNDIHDAAVQLESALADLPAAIAGCTCNCVEFQKKGAKNG